MKPLPPPSYTDATPFLFLQQHLHDTIVALTNPQLILFKLHREEHKEFLNESTVTLHLNSFLVVHVHPNYIPTARNTLTPQKNFSQFIAPPPNNILNNRLWKPAELFLLMKMC